MFRPVQGHPQGNKLYIVESTEAPANISEGTPSKCTMKFKSVTCLCIGDIFALAVSALYRVFTKDHLSRSYAAFTVNSKD
jgi:hypothetical protein